MEQPISEYIKISVELILTALLLTFIIRYASLSDRAYNLNYTEDYSNSVLGSHATLYMYDNKIITASDAIELMYSYPLDYEYEIRFLDSNGNEIKPTVYKSKANQIETGKYKDYWSDVELASIFKGYEYEQFKSQLVRFDGTDIVKTVVFTYSSTL